MVADSNPRAPCIHLAVILFSFQSHRLLLALLR
jgi:hypothetical protein